jgi:GntR family transcriptional regulator
VPKAVAEIKSRDLKRKPLLMLLEEAGVQLGGATQTISARLADAVVARHLDVAVGSALLAVTRLVRDTDERPVQLLQGLYRPDRYQYQLQLSRIGDIDAKVWVSEELSATFN